MSPIRFVAFRRLLAGPAAVLLLASCAGEPTAPSAEPAAGPSLAKAAGRSFTWSRLAGSPTGSIVHLSYSGLAPGSRYLYAGSFPDFGTGRLFRFDLKFDRWSEIATTGWPSGKYRHFVIDEVNQRLVTFWDGLGQAYAVGLNGGAWYPIGATGNSEEYYEGYAFWNPVSRAVSRFAGYGFGTFKNTLWELGSTGAWSLVATSDPKPTPRFGSLARAVDPVSGKAYFAEQSLGAAGLADDLWELDLTTRAWRNLIPLGVSAYPRIASGMASLAPVSSALIRFGGTEAIFGSTRHYSDVVIYRPGASDWDLVATVGTVPEARRHAGVFFDEPRRRIIVVGGAGVGGSLDDVWELRLPRSIQ